jgi:hypothetical protein
MQPHPYITAALLAALCAPAWAINKCTGADGRVVYQDAACAGGRSVNLSGAGKSDPSSPQANQWRRIIARQARDERVAAAIAERKIFIGMTADDARQSWGAPSKINTSIGSYGRHEQWVYDRGRSLTQYVYVQNGLVTSLQTPE